MGFHSKNTGVSCHFLLQGIFLTPIRSASPALAGRFFTSEPPGKPTQDCHFLFSVQFSSVAQLCPTLRNSTDCSTPGLPIHCQLPEFTQTHVHWVGGDTIQPSHTLPSPSSPAFNISHNQGLFQWVSSSHQVAKVLEFQLQHQSFQWIFRTDFL